MSTALANIKRKFIKACMKENITTQDEIINVLDSIEVGTMTVAAYKAHDSMRKNTRRHLIQKAHRMARSYRKAPKSKTVVCLSCPVW